MTVDLVSGYGLYCRPCERKACQNYRHVLGLFIPELNRTVGLCPAHFAEAELIMSGKLSAPVAPVVAPKPEKSEASNPPKLTSVLASPQIELYILDVLAKSRSPLNIRQIWLGQSHEEMRARDTIAGAIRRLVGYGYAEVVSGKGHSHDPFMYVITDSGRLQHRMHLVEPTRRAIPRAPR